MFYAPVQTERYFERERRYCDITWKHFPNTVDAFERRIRGWYIEPIEILLERRNKAWVKRFVRWLTGRQDGGHYSFTVMVMACMLIDTLSQFVRGKPEGTSGDFKSFVKQHLPSYSGSLSTAIDGYRPPRNPSSTIPRYDLLADIPAVLYQGFRCGILHQAHAPLYCGIVPGNNPPKVELTNHATYAAGAVNSVVGTDCPVVVICPEHLFDEIMMFFGGYLRDLKDRSTTHDQLRACFKMKFADSFGIDLTASTF
jgi:hypothetical protein